MIQIWMMAGFLRCDEDAIILGLIEDDAIDEIVNEIPDDVAARFICSRAAGPKWPGGVCSPQWMRDFHVASPRWQRYVGKVTGGVSEP